VDTVHDFEDMLHLLNQHEVRYLIIGGLAFIYHAKPRYTKDMDLWIGPAVDNIVRANRALEDFGSPISIEPDNLDQIVQLGVAPDRIDIMLTVPGVRFETAWNRRNIGNYGSVATNWMDIDSLIRAKRRIDNPRHQEDVRVLLEVKKIKEKNKS